MVDAIQSILNCVEDDVRKTLKTGGIATQAWTVETAEELKQKIAEFKGIGWLLTTGDKLIEIKNEGDAIDPRGFIVRGELFDGTRTLQVSRTGRVWTVAIKEFDQARDGLVQVMQFRRHGLEQNVCYQVEYNRVRVNDHDEIQPVNYRFCGWNGRV